MHCHQEWISYHFIIPVIVGLRNIKASVNAQRGIIEQCQDKQSLESCMESIADHFHS